MARDRSEGIPQVKNSFPYRGNLVPGFIPLPSVSTLGHQLPRIDMSTTLNHVALSRAQLAQASELADAGSTALADTHLRIAADHALRALDRGGAAPADVDFDVVQELIDSAVARPTSPPPASIPLYGGPRGAMNARGAEAAERAIARIGAAIKGAVKR
jgi:hypothetical protein